MNERDFFYWLQGYFELSGNESALTQEQVKVIKEHMALVATKVTEHSVQVFEPYVHTFGEGHSLIEDYKDLPLVKAITALSC